MRSQLKFSILIVCLAGAIPVVVSAEDKIDFFRRFLDESPTTKARSSNLAQDWLKDVATSATSAARTSTSQSITHSVRQQSESLKYKKTDLPAVERPTLRIAARPVRKSANHRKPPRAVLEEPLTTRKPPLHVAARPARSIMSQPKPPMAVPTDAAQTVAKAEADRVDASVKRRVDSLQIKLETAERALDAKFAQFSKRREAALEKNDEATLKRIEKSEQAAVASYEKNIQRLLDAALPESTAGPSNVATTTVPTRQNTPATASQQRQRSSIQPTPLRQRGQLPVQRPVANRQPAASKSLPSWAQPKRSVQPQSRQSYRNPAASRAPSTAPARPQPQSKPPEKKKFRLWPFR